MTTRFPRIRVDLTRMGLGVVQLSTRTTREKEHARRVVLFDDLVADSQIEIIRALVLGKKKGGVSWEELIAARKRNELSGAKVLVSVKADRTLSEAVAATVPLMGKAKATRARYALSLKQLQAQTVVPFPHAPMRVKDLVALDWPALQTGWPNSAGDWNNLVRAVGRFLTLYLGHKHDPFRLEVMKQVTLIPTEGRVPDLSLEVFERIMHAVPEHIRPAYYVLLVTGMRVGEYLRCTKENLLPATRQIAVPGTKTGSSRAHVAVAPEMWPWIDAGIPSPLRYKWLRLNWNRACLAVGAAKEVDGEYSGLVMHDLRHALAQWTSDAGTPQQVLQHMLRHSSPAMTAKYAKRSNSRTVATTISNIVQRRAAR